MFSRALSKAIKLRDRRPVIFHDLERYNPVSEKFGCDRGTPIDRYYIEKFISEHSNLILGNVLEVAESKYSRMFGCKESKLDRLLFVDGKGDGLHADLTAHSTLPDSKYDCFICTQTLNFIYDIEAAVSGCYRLLKPSGKVLATVASICQISRYDADRWGDFWRVTSQSAFRLFTEAGFRNVTVGSHGNMLAVIAQLQGIAVEDLPKKELLDHIDPDYPLITTILAER